MKGFPMYISHSIVPMIRGGYFHQAQTHEDTDNAIETGESDFLHMLDQHNEWIDFAHPAAFAVFEQDGRCVCLKTVRLEDWGKKITQWFFDDVEALTFSDLEKYILHGKSSEMNGNLPPLG